MPGFHILRKVLVAKTALEHLSGCLDLSLFGHPNPPEMWLLALKHLSEGIVPLCPSMDARWVGVSLENKTNKKALARPLEFDGILLAAMV